MMTPKPAPPKAKKSRDLALVRQALARWADPVVWAKDVLGVRLWSGQKRMLRAIANHSRVAIRSGHKCGKSTVFAIAALWWWCTKKNASVVITAPTSRQIEKIIWKEVRKLYKAARWPLGGNLHLKPETGLQAPDGREIIGFATDEPERLAGFSGSNLLFLVDEASGVDRPIFNAIDGNRAGGAHVALISNPTQVSGVFFDAFHSEAAEWHTEHISSVDCARLAPKELGEETTGLATLGWCHERLRILGEKSPEYQVRVLGNFPTESDDTMIAPALVTAAQARWHEAEPEDGLLQFGVDVARFGRDLSAVAFSRGDWLSPIHTLAKKDNVQVAGKVIELIRNHRRFNEPVRVCIDTTNNAGVADILRASDLEGVEIVDVGYASKPTAPGFTRMRDQLWGAFKEWLQTGAIPRDKLLAADATAPKYGFGPSGGIKVEGKDELRARIGRSPDRADCAALAVFPAHTLVKSNTFFAIIEPEGSNAEDDDD